MAVSCKLRRFRLPAALPPSFRGSAIRFVYLIEVKAVYEVHRGRLHARVCRMELNSPCLACFGHALLWALPTQGWLPAPKTSCICLLQGALRRLCMKRWRPRPSWCGPAQGTRQQRQNGGPWKTLAGVRRMRERPAGRCPRRRGSTAGEATQGAGRSLEGPALLSLGDLLEVTLAGELAALGRDQGWRRPHHRQEVGQGPGRRHSCPGWGRGRGRVYLEARLAGQGPRLEQGQGVHMAAAMTRTWACATTSLVETTAGRLFLNKGLPALRLESLEGGVQSPLKAAGTRNGRYTCKQQSAVVRGVGSPVFPEVNAP